MVTSATICMTVIVVAQKVRQPTSCSWALALPGAMGAVSRSSTAAPVAAAAESADSFLVGGGRARTRMLPGCRSVCCTGSIQDKPDPHNHRHVSTSSDPRSEDRECSQPG